MTRRTLLLLAALAFALAAVALIVLLRSLA